MCCLTQIPARLQTTSFRSGQASDLHQQNNWSQVLATGWTVLGILSPPIPTTATMMKRLLPLVFLSAPLLVTAQPIEEFLPSTVDARSLAMGRTSILSAEGSNAIFSNPAIIATIQNIQVQGGGRAFVGATVAGDDEDFETSSYPVHWKLDHLSFAMPYALSDSSFHLAFGIGYHTYYDSGFKVGDEEGNLLFTSGGGLNTINPTVAVSYQGKYFAGLSYHKSVRSTITMDNENFNDESEIETSASFFMLGLLARVTPGITLGGMYRSAFEWDWEPENSGDIEWDHPALWGVGAAFNLSSSWTLAAEYRSRPFSNYERNGRDEAFGVDDGYSVRLGFEKAGEVPFRFGLFRDAIPEHDVGKDDPKYLTGLTVGIGFNISGVVLNSSLEAAYWQQEFTNDDKLAELFIGLRASALYRFN